MPYYGKYAGCFLQPTYKTNRRTGGTGLKLLRAVQKAGGMDYQRYLEIGGGANHLEWDVAAGNIKLVRPKKLTKAARARAEAGLIT